MALAAGTIWEIESGGSDTNGGSVNPTTVVTDYSQQLTAQVAVTNAVAAGSTTITSASGLFTAAMVGNGVYLQGGTGSLAAGWYQVVSFTNSTTIVVDRVVAAGTGITLNLGGALASLGGVFVTGAGLSGGHIVYVKSGTYSVTSATINIAGGTCSGSISPAFIGYSTNRTLTNTDTKPLIQFGVSGISMFVTRGLVYNIAFDGNAKTTARVSGANDTTFYNRCTFTAMNTAGGGGEYYFCSATANSGAVYGGNCYYCESFANTATPNANTASLFVGCLSYNNTGATTDGFNMSGTNAVAIGCIAYGNGRAGFNFVSTSRVCSTINCHAENNATYGYDFSAVGVAMIITNCSAYNNTTARYPAAQAAAQQINGFVTITAGSVFVAAGSANFALNNTASQGASLRAAGFPALSVIGSTAAYHDIGAAQHQDTGGGGTTYQGFFIQ